MCPSSPPEYYETFNARNDFSSVYLYSTAIVALEPSNRLAYYRSSELPDVDTSIYTIESHLLQWPRDALPSRSPSCGFPKLRDRRSLQRWAPAFLLECHLAAGVCARVCARTAQPSPFSPSAGISIYAPVSLLPRARVYSAKRARRCPPFACAHIHT